MLRGLAAFCLVAAAVALIGVAAAGVPAFQLMLTSLDIASPARVDRPVGYIDRAGGAPPAGAVVGALHDQHRTAARSGDIVHHTISVEAKQVALPDGDWRVAGSAVTSQPSVGGRASRPVVSLVLVRLHGDSVDAAVLIQTNKATMPAHWGRPSGCERSDLYAARIRYASDHDGSCSYVARVEAVPGVKVAIDPAWRDTLRQAAAAGWKLPTGWLVAAYRITDPRDALQVRYFFAPWPAGAIRGAGTGVSSVTQQQVNSLVAWSEIAWGAIGSGFRNRLDDDGRTSLPDWLPPLQPASAPGTGVGSRPGVEDTLSVGHAGLKTITYRIFGSMTDFSVNYFYLGSAAAAGSLSVLGAVASSALYFVHEVAWSYADAQSQGLRDLPGIGVERGGPQSD